MNMKLIIKICFTLILLLISSQSYADVYTRSYEFGPIHIERDNLLKAVSEIYSYVESINGVSDKSSGYISLGRDDFLTKIALPISEKDYAKFPKISYEARVHIENDYGGIITDVQLWLDDRSRKLTVTGKDYDHVTGLINVVQEKLSFYNVTTSGFKFRMILFIISVLLLSSAPYFIVILFKKERDRTIISILWIMLMLVILFIPPWEIVFPGFLAGVENRSFLEKYSALFTFLGFAIAVIVPASTLIVQYFNKKRIELR
jgi:hypothetical protein